MSEGFKIREAAAIARLDRWRDLRARRDRAIGFASRVAAYASHLRVLMGAFRNPLQSVIKLFRLILVLPPLQPHAAIFPQAGIEETTQPTQLSRILEKKEKLAPPPDAKPLPTPAPSLGRLPEMVDIPPPPAVKPPASSPVIGIKTNALATAAAPVSLDGLIMDICSARDVERAKLRQLREHLFGLREKIDGALAVLDSFD